MAKRLTEVTAVDCEELLVEVRKIDGSSCAQEAAQKFIDMLYGRFSKSLVLLRLFCTMRYDGLQEDDQRFVDGRGRDTDTGHLIHGATPIFTLLGTRGKRPEWNDRHASAHFRCIPLASTAFVASLSMLSRQFESVGLDLGLIDAWEEKVSCGGRADMYRGMLFIRDSATDRDGQGRMIVPRQAFVLENGVKSTIGFGSGYSRYPTLVTLFAFTNEELTEQAMTPFASLLEGYITSTESLVGQGRFFAGRS